MNTKRKVLITTFTVVLFLLIGLMFFLKKGNHIKISPLQIESLKKELPKEVYSFIFENDTLNINTNSMANFRNFSMDSIIKDSSLGEEIVYRFEWNKESQKWNLESRWTSNFHAKKKPFMKSVHESYNLLTQSWKVESYDSAYYPKNSTLPSYSTDGTWFYYDKPVGDNLYESANYYPSNGYTKNLRKIDPTNDNTLSLSTYYGRLNHGEIEWSLAKKSTFEYVKKDVVEYIYTPASGKKELRLDKRTVTKNLNDTLKIIRKYIADTIGNLVLKDSMIYKNFETIRQQWTYRFKNGIPVLVYRDSTNSDSINYFSHTERLFSREDANMTNYKSINDELIYSDYSTWNTDSNKFIKHLFTEVFYTPYQKIEVNYKYEIKGKLIEKKIRSIDLYFFPDSLTTYMIKCYGREDCIDVSDVEFLYKKEGYTIKRNMINYK